RLHRARSGRHDVADGGSTARSGQPLQRTVSDGEGARRDGRRGVHSHVGDFAVRGGSRPGSVCSPFDARAGRGLRAVTCNLPRRAASNGRTNSHHTGVQAMQPSRVALVTGSGKKRVGSVVADALARRGYAIAVHYRSSAAEAEETAAGLRAHGVEVGSFPADLADEKAVRAMVRDVLGGLGRIDVLVNCAAVWMSKPLEEVTAADVRFHFDTNALGTFLTCQQAGLAMAKQPEGGVIVNVGDWAEVRPYPG